MFSLLQTLKVRHWTLRPDCGMISSFHVGYVRKLDPEKMQTLLIIVSLINFDTPTLLCGLEKHFCVCLVLSFFFERIILKYKSQ